MSAPVPVGPSSIDLPSRGLTPGDRVAPRASAEGPARVEDAFVPATAEATSHLPIVGPASQPPLLAAAPPTPPAATMGAVRTALAMLDFPALDPFAASVASVVWAGSHAVFSGKTEKVDVPCALRKPLPLEVNLKNGKDAPMLLILPGLGSNKNTAQVRALKSRALDCGMNYTLIPNSWSSVWLDADPLHAPGNLPMETEAVRSILHALQERHPGFYDKVSTVGYSYGGLLGASVIAHDNDPGAGARTVQGSLVAISPPENLLDSMRELDDLRNQYEIPDNLRRVLAIYGAAVPYYGYEHIGESLIAHRPETNAEKYLADTMASRDHLQEVFERYDVISGANRLPLHHEVATNGRPDDSALHQSLAEQQAKQVLDSTYAQYTDAYLASDLNATDPTATVEQLAQDYSYTNLLALASGHGVPVLTLTAADDYILDPSDLSAVRALESNPAPDQATRVLDHGGHVGVLFNPQARDQIYDFLAHPPKP